MMWLAQLAPDQAREVLILPVALCFLAFLFWLFGWSSVARGGKGYVRILSILLIAWAIFVGLGYVWRMWNPELGAFYRAQLVGRSRNLMAHYLAPILPLLTIAAMAGVSVAFRRRIAED